jgi:hypothetical protein
MDSLLTAVTGGRHKSFDMCCSVNWGLVPESRLGADSKRKQAMTTSDTETGGRYVDIEDTRLYVVERGDGYPLLVFHGDPASTTTRSATTSTPWPTSTG